MKKPSVTIAQGKPGKKPTYADLLNDNPGAKSGRVYYPDWDSVPLMNRDDPQYVDYDDNIIGILGDGNCMFRAISFAVNDPMLDHKSLRQKVCTSEPADVLLREMYGTGLDEHVESMRRLGEYGGEPELRTAARVVSHRICVWTDGRLTTQYGEPGQPIIHLRYNRVVRHYDLYIAAPGPVPLLSQQELAEQPSPAHPEDVAEQDAGWTTVKRRRRPPPEKRAHETVLGIAKNRQSPTSEAYQGALTREMRPVETAVVTLHASTPSNITSNVDGNEQVPNDTISSKPDMEKSATKPRMGRPKKRRRVGLPLPKRANCLANTAPENMEPAPVPVLENTEASDHVLQVAGVSVPVLQDAELLVVPSAPSCFTNNREAAADSAQNASKVTGPGSEAMKRRRGRPKKRRRAARPSEFVQNGDKSAKEPGAQPAVDILQNVSALCTDAGSHVFPLDSESGRVQENVDHDVVQPTDSEFVVAEGISTLTRAMLDECVSNCSHTVVIDNVVTDFDPSNDGQLSGPWLYRDSKKVTVSYLVGDFGEKRRINLCNLLLRGFCRPSRGGRILYNSYSWLRFKDIVKKSGRSVAHTVEDENLFHETLRQVDRYYSTHPSRAKEEGLQPHRGPQTWEDRYDLLQLHYYGKGWYRFFRLSTLHEIFLPRHGSDRWAEFQANPWTEALTEEHFEMMLSEVHNKLRNRHWRYTHLIEAYAGPQCNEDRGTAARTQYNVHFVTRSTDSVGGARRKGRPVAQAPPQHIVAPSSTDTGILGSFFLRTCVECRALRVVDARAASKYPLGQYEYAGEQQRVRFTCDRLVGISCDTAPDFVACTAQDKPATWVALGAVAARDQRPPPAIILRSLRLLNASDNTEETEVVGAYYYRGDSRAAGWTGRRSLLTRVSNSGVVTLGTQSQRRRFQAVTNSRFNLGRFTVDSPREAKCCQPWHDPLGADPEDPSADLKVNSLQVLRDVHALYDSLRRVRCIKCNQQTPGLPYPDYAIQVPERGTMTDLAPDSTVLAAVSRSALLKAGSQCTVMLDPKFRGANGTVLTERDVSGVCTVCASSYDIDADNNIIARPLSSDINDLRPDPGDNHDFVDAERLAVETPVGAVVAGDSLNDEPEPTHISLLSIDNLVSTDVYSNDEYHQFVNHLTPAEIMVLRPVHLVVSVLRLRSNQVPFTKHGSICYPLKDACQARNLPWYDFSTLPFIVLVQTRRDGTSDAAMVNMQNILRARNFMERQMSCKYNPRETRPYYRFVADQWTPFSNENLARLQNQLTSRYAACTPTGLRVVLASDIHERADKVLRVNEFYNWLESGFAMADELWNSFRLSRSGEGADMTEAGQDDLWDVIENYVVGRAVDATAARDGDEAARGNDADGDDVPDAGDIDITMRQVVECAVANGWFLPTAVNGDDADFTGEPSSVLLQCCEELEMLGREFGNDEGNRAGGVSAGAVAGPQTERPEDIRQQGISRSALFHVPMPGVDRENPLPESAPGYMQMAFPEVFRSGDADPYQDRRVSIRQPVTSWRANWLHWMARQPEAEGNVDFQFVVGSQLSRDQTGQEARVAIRMADFPDGLPTKEELMNDLALRQKVAQSLLCLCSKLQDSDAYWRVRKQEAIGTIRYLESPPPWQPDAIPQEVYLWQTRAVPYNHYPAIHRLCDKAAASEALGDDRYLSARLANTLRHPGTVAWMSALIGEMDTLAVAVERFGATYYLVRSEWGANANPHVHRHLISDSFSQFLHDLQNHLMRKVAELERDLRAEDPTLERDTSHSAAETGVIAAWRDCQQQYIERIGRCYTNWNAGFTKDGERTFDFAYDRKTTVCRARMAPMLDEALSTGNFIAVDELYVRVINGTLRHTGHSGRGDAPSAKDGCAVRRLVVDKAATEEAQSEGRKRPVKKQVITCKRRMPRCLRSESAVVKDAHDPRFYQFETASNDKWMGGHDPFTVLHILNNIDDKAVVPAWLTRTPRIEWKRSPADGGGYTFHVQLSKARGDGSVEYALKYGFKPVAPIRTPSDVLLTALERREAGDNVDLGVIQRMYNQVSTSTCQSIFQVIHKNWQLPLLQRNVDVRSFNMSGCRMVKPATAAADPVYVYADAVERFNARVGDAVCHGNIPSAEFKRVMSVFEFCDRFTSVEKRIDGEKQFKIGRRNSLWKDVRKLVMLAPHHGKSKANPARDQFWKYARDIVLWCQPCWVSQDLMPPPDCVTDDDIAAHWRAKYDQLMASDVYKPLWVTRYHDEHRTAEPDDDTSDESDGGDEADGVADANAADDVGDEHEPNAERVRDRFYQTALDAMVACPPENIDDAEQRDERAATSVANPAGYDFQAQWLGDRIVNPDHVRRNYARLAALGAGDAAHAAPVTPSGRQLVLPRIVKGYVVQQRQWARSRREWDAYDQAMLKWRRSRSSRVTEPVPPSVADIRDRPPKALRAFLLGDPGAGKSTTLRTTVHELTEMLVDDQADWTDVVKLSAPTGCASFHMAHGATTIHRLYAIRVGQVNDDPLAQNSRRLAALCERLGPELGLLIFDEFSMIQRKMLRWVVKRLEEAGINLDHIGVLFVGDPAQILPIGDSPVWSIRQRMDDGKECSEASLLGMAAFRELFRMPPLDTVDGYDTWRRAAGRNPHELNDSERREVARFHAAALVGDYETVYLNEVRRTVENDQLACHLTKVIIPSFRYGRATRENLKWLQENTATAEHMAADPLWSGAVTLHGNHWFSESAEHRATVESDNARALVRFANERDTPVMAVNAQHLPARKAARLQKLSAKEFRGVPSVFFACSGLPLMLLENVAPSVGLFNGAHVEFVGPLYLDDDWQVTLTRGEYEAKVVTSGVMLTSPIDTPGSDRDRMYQIPIGSVIIKVNGHSVDGDERRLAELVAESATVRLVFHTPKRPHRPDFVLVRVPSYTDNGGPNILGIEDADDLVPIRMVKRGRDKGKKSSAIEDDHHTEFRVAAPLAGGSAFTGFKGQGATLERVVAKVKAWVETPGFWTVVVSRVRHPHHLHIPADQWPTVEELRLQRLNQDVLEAEIFERQMKINAAKTWRHCVAADGGGDWSYADNVIDDAVHAAWRREQERDVAASVSEALRAETLNVSPADVLLIIEKMAVTDELLILAEPVFVRQLHYRVLQRNKIARGRRRIVTTGAPETGFHCCWWWAAQNTS